MSHNNHKMALEPSVYAEGGAKQHDASHDDGYETSVDHLDLRPQSHPQPEVKDSTEPDTTQHHPSVSQMQQMQLVHGGHPHHHFVDRLHGRGPADSRLAMPEARLIDPSEDNERLHRGSPGQDTRLSPHDSLDGAHVGQQPHEMDGRLCNDENQLPPCDGALEPHLDTIEDRINPNLDNHGISNMENRLNRERLSSLDRRISPQLNLEHPMTPNMEHRMDLEHNMSREAPPGHVDHMTQGLENRMVPHDRLAIDRRTHESLDMRDRHMPMESQEHLSRERLGRMTPQEHLEQMNRERQLGLGGRMTPQEHIDQMNRERQLGLGGRMTPQEQIDQMNRERLGRMTPQEQMEQINRDRQLLGERLTPLELEQMNRERHLAMGGRMTPQEHDQMNRERHGMTPHEQMEQMNRERQMLGERMTPQELDHMNRERHGMENRMTPQEQMDQIRSERMMSGGRMTPQDLERMNRMGDRMTPQELDHLNRDRPRDLGMDNHIDKRVPGHENHLGAMDARMNSRLDGHDMNLDHMNGMGARDLSMENRMIAHENHMNNMVNHDMHHHDGRMDHMNMMGHGHVHENHMAAHMGHMNPHEHLQHTHAHMQGLHHSHHGHPQHGHPHHMHHPHHPHHLHGKCDSMEDPYSFVDEENGGMGPQMVAQQPRPSPIMLQTVPKKRGRKKKIKPEDGMMEAQEIVKKDNGLVKPIKERKKHDRFNGMPEEEVVKRTLPDHLTPNLDIVIIGTNPGLYAAYKGHHYAGPGTHIWKCLYLSGLTPEPMTADDDYKLLQVGIGFTNMVSRATKGSADLTRKEIKEGSQVLLEKLQKFKPKIAVFNGKLIYEVFSGNKDFHFGRQPDFVDGTNTYMWVMPSSSARCAQLPRAADKVPFYTALKKFRDYLNGLIADIDDNDVVFTDQKLKTFYESEVKGDHKDEQGNFFPYSRIPGQELTDLSVNKKEPFDPNRPEKKKRGRPKKIRVEGEDPPPPKERVKKEKPPVDSDAPKKKRGRPKKIKTEDQPPIPAQPAAQPIQNGSSLNASEHTSSSNPTSACFSPPIQSPSGFCQGFSPAYPTGQNTAVPQFTPRGPSPPPYHPSPHHPSPLPPQYSSPPPTSQSQAFTHSDLSSEISAAISSEHLGSPPPTSPSLGPPDFEPPTSMQEDTSHMSAKEDGDGECRFPSPTPSESNTYQYRGFQEPEAEHKSNGPQFPRQPSPEFPQKRTNQDVASKSLSGLESLVDQIPSIADNGGVPPVGAPAVPDSFEAQPSGQYEDYMGSYPGYSGPPAPHYTSSTNYSSAGYIPPTQSNFSVSSLANSSHEAQVASSFSVSSLASNYTSPGYPNLMSAPHLVVPQPSLFGSGMNMPPNYQYPSQYTSAPASFPYSPHALHVPSPNYPPYSPYSNSSYPQPYLANHVLDRIKQERMDIGFGGF